MPLRWREGAELASVGRMPESARDLMTTPVLTVAPDAPLLEVQHLFVVAHISGAPIVDKTGKVLGVVPLCQRS
jgi:CBS domain-containing protein